MKTLKLTFGIIGMILLTLTSCTKEPLTDENGDGVIDNDDANVVVKDYVKTWEQQGFAPLMKSADDYFKILTSKKTGKLDSIMINTGHFGDNEVEGYFHVHPTEPNKIIFEKYTFTYQFPKTYINDTITFEEVPFDGKIGITHREFYNMGIGVSLQLYTILN
jgi:hypothetical protein